MHSGTCFMLCDCKTSPLCPALQRVVLPPASLLGQSHNPPPQQQQRAGPSERHANQPPQRRAARKAQLLWQRQKQKRKQKREMEAEAETETAPEAKPQRHFFMWDDAEEELLERLVREAEQQHDVKLGMHLQMQMHYTALCTALSSSLQRSFAFRAIRSTSSVALCLLCNCCKL